MSSEIWWTNLWFDEKLLYFGLGSSECYIKLADHNDTRSISKWSIFGPKQKSWVFFFTAKYSWFYWYEKIFPYIIYTKKMKIIFCIFYAWNGFPWSLKKKHIWPFLNTEDNMINNGIFFGSMPSIPFFLMNNSCSFHEISKLSEIWPYLHTRSQLKMIGFLWKTHIFHVWRPKFH